jgi:uroporphyrinogen-III synthase
MKPRALVANTRGEPPGGPLASALRASGLESLHCPTVAFEPPEDPGELRDALDALERIDWVIFTSAHAVDATCSQAQWRASAAGHALPRLAAVGRATARRLAELGYQADIVPEVAGAHPLASAVAAAAGTLEGARVLWPRADLARRDLAVALSRAGATVVAPIAYRTVPAPPESLLPLKRALEKGTLDAIAFCSPSSAQNLARGLGHDGLTALAGKLVVASIGPTTSAALATLGLPADVEAPEPSTAQLARALAARLREAAGGAA